MGSCTDLQHFVWVNLTEWTLNLVRKWLVIANEICPTIASMGIPCHADHYCSLQDSQLGMIMDDFPPQNLLVLWQLASREEAFCLVATKFFHVLWTKHVLSSAIWPYSQVLISNKSKGTMFNCLRGLWDKLDSQLQVRERYYIPDTGLFYLIIYGFWSKHY